MAENKKDNPRVAAAQTQASAHLGPRFMMLFIAFAISFWYVVDVTRENILLWGNEKPEIHRIKPVPPILTGLKGNFGVDFSRRLTPLAETPATIVNLRQGLAARFDRAVTALGKTR